MRFTTISYICLIYVVWEICSCMDHSSTMIPFRLVLEDLLHHCYVDVCLAWNYSLLHSCVFSSSSHPLILGGHTFPHFFDHFHPQLLFTIISSVHHRLLFCESYENYSLINGSIK